jgi:sugar lactone lactonase YvrE
MFRTRSLLAAVAASALATAVAAIPSSASAQNDSRDRHRVGTYAIDGKQVFPEGVAYDGKYLYTASVTDGTVYRGPVKGKTLKPFLPGGQDGRTITAGLTVVGHRLIVVGANTGLVWVYDTRSGHLVAKFSAPSGLSTPAFLNDVTVAHDGTAYITDSFSPVIYKIDKNEIRGTSKDSDGLLEVAFDISAATPAPPGGFNGNGIVTTPDGRGLLVIFTTTGVLYRVDLRTGAVAPVNLGGKKLTNGDGIVRDGKDLYFIRNFDNLISPVRVTSSGHSGIAGSDFTYAGADTPTTAVLVGDQLVVVNSQFDTYFQGAPLTSEVFTLSRISIP